MLMIGLLLWRQMARQQALRLEYHCCVEQDTNTLWLWLLLGSPAQRQRLLYPELSLKAAGCLHQMLLSSLRAPGTP